jgi:hypothetical protein
MANPISISNKNLLEKEKADNLINYPFVAYPGIPLCGYMNTVVYNKEIIRLLDTIKELQQTISNCKEPVLLHLTFGAAMEELYTDTEDKTSIDIQWQQLFPIHLQNLHIENPNIKIYNLIVSPNKYFASDSFKEPLFINYLKDFKFKLSGDRLYIDETENIKVMIFNSPLPTIDTYRLNNIVEKWKKIEVDSIDINKLIQTKNDIEFVNQFYKELSNLMDIISANNGFTTCFSFAVFNNNSIHANADYNLFPEIKTLFKYPYNKSNKLLAEWTYKKQCYTVRLFNNCSQFNFLGNLGIVKHIYISYANHNLRYDDIYHIYLDYEDNKIELVA